MSVQQTPEQSTREPTRARHKYVQVAAKRIRIFVNSESLANLFRCSRYKLCAASFSAKTEMRLRRSLLATSRTRGCVIMPASLA